MALEQAAFFNCFDDLSTGKLKGTSQSDDKTSFNLGFAECTNPSLNENCKKKDGVDDNIDSMAFGAVIVYIGAQFYD